MSLIVQKFGGTSVANVERVRHVAQIITNTYDQGNSVIAVVSAQGDTTDELIAKAAEITDKPSSREMDVLLSTGEQISMSLLAMAIEQMGYPVISLTGWQAGFLTESTHRNAPHQKDQHRAPAERAGQEEHRHRRRLPGHQPLRRHHHPRPRRQRHQCGGHCGGDEGGQM